MACRKWPGLSLAPSCITAAAMKALDPEGHFLCSDTLYGPRHCCSIFTHLWTLLPLLLILPGPCTVYVTLKIYRLGHEDGKMRKDGQTIQNHKYFIFFCLFFLGHFQRILCLEKHLDVVLVIYKETIFR